jgi:hypothetical protein
MSFAIQKSYNLSHGLFIGKVFLLVMTIHFPQSLNISFPITFGNKTLAKKLAQNLLFFFSKTEVIPSCFSFPYVHMKLLQMISL